jgi:ATP-dependent protease ClpP protease subunit
MFADAEDITYHSGLNGGSRKRGRWQTRSASEKTEHDDDEKPAETAKAAADKKPHLGESDVSSRCMCRGNHIYFYAGVSKDSVYRMQDHLQKINADFEALQQKNPTVTMVPKPIVLHINSFGGGVFAAFAGIDFILQSKIPVHTVVEGATASAGTLMSVVGKKRFIRPHASMLIHQLSSWFGGKMTEIDDNYQNLQQMHESIRELYVTHTRISGDDLGELLKHDVWWKADKCIEVGLVDGVWDGSDSPQ